MVCSIASFWREEMLWRSLQESRCIKMIKVMACLEPNESLASKASSARRRLWFSKALKRGSSPVNTSARMPKVVYIFSRLHSEHSALESFPALNPGIKMYLSVFDPGMCWVPSGDAENTCILFTCVRMNHTKYLSALQDQTAFAEAGFSIRIKNGTNQDCPPLLLFILELPSSKVKELENKTGVRS